MEIYSTELPFQKGLCNSTRIFIAVAGSLSVLGVSRFAKKYPAVLTALLKSLLELVCKYEKAING